MKHQTSIAQISLKSLCPAHQLGATCFNMYAVMGVNSKHRRRLKTDKRLAWAVATPDGPSFQIWWSFMSSLKLHAGSRGPNAWESQIRVLHRVIVDGLQEQYWRSERHQSYEYANETLRFCLASNMTFFVWVLCDCIKSPNCFLFRGQLKFWFFDL